MATIIPKLITDTDKYFQYEGSANPTTQDELQAYMKNEHSIVECLTDMLWQPSTSYNIGHVLRSPNMPKGFQAVALVTGTTGANEPDWGDGSIDITDGSMKWKVTTANITVPDASGNIPILDFVYPIGSLYWSKKSTNPATLFGGTWTQIKDKFILAAGDSYAQGATGGSATVTLTTAQLPAHNHSGSAQDAGWHGHSASSNSTGNHTHTLRMNRGEGGTLEPKILSDGADDWGIHANGNAITSAGSHSHTITVNGGGNHTHTLTINNTGSGQAHENMPPYVTYYCWERTA